MSIQATLLKGSTSPAPPSGIKQFTLYIWKKANCMIQEQLFPLWNLVNQMHPNSTAIYFPISNDLIINKGYIKFFCDVHKFPNLPVLQSNQDNHVLSD